MLKELLYATNIIIHGVGCHDTPFCQGSLQLVMLNDFLKKYKQFQIKTLDSSTSFTLVMVMLKQLLYVTKIIVHGVECHDAPFLPELGSF